MRNKLIRNKLMRIFGISCAIVILSGCSNTNSSVDKVIQSQIDQSGADARPAADVKSDASENTTDNANVKQTADNPYEGKIDIDLTQLSSTMVYSEVSNMTYTPNNYLGKIVKMNGPFSIYQSETTGQLYFACVISDATACCAQGIEFELMGEHVFPRDYPEQGKEITVTGVFETYEEDGYTYCRLKEAVME